MNTERRADGSEVRRFTLDENYSELMEQGAVWCRATDMDTALAERDGVTFQFKVACADLDQARREVASMRQVLSLVHAQSAHDGSITNELRDQIDALASVVKEQP